MTPTFSLPQIKHLVSAGGLQDSTIRVKKRQTSVHKSAYKLLSDSSAGQVDPNAPTFQLLRAAPWPPGSRVDVCQAALAASPQQLKHYQRPPGAVSSRWHESTNIWQSAKRLCPYCVLACWQQTAGTMSQATLASTLDDWPPHHSHIKSCLD